jgi:MoaA/NifB/PqqE/SkfB family radical SAM enzyme
MIRRIFRFFSHKKDVPSNDSGIDDINSTFCVIPWKHAHICDSGVVKLCCAIKPIRDEKTGEFLNVYDQPFPEIWNSDYVRSVRQSMINGIHIPDCAEFCGRVEKNGGISRRMRENEQWVNGRISKNGISLHDLIDQSIKNNHFVDWDPIALDFEVSNLCNLACRMCDADRSSKIEHDEVHRPWVDKKYKFGKWQRNSLTLAPNPLINLEYEGLLEKTDQEGQHFLWIEKIGSIILRNFSEMLETITVQFYPRMQPEHVVRISMNDKVVYEGSPAVDGFNQKLSIKDLEIVNDLAITIESNTGIGITNLEIKRHRPMDATKKLFGSRLSHGQHWMKEQDLLYGELLRNPKSIQVIKFVGGEPLINKEVIETIDYLMTEGDPKNLIISIVTNATIFNEKVFENASNMQVMVVAVSLDAIGDKLEYIRYPAKWNVIEENIERIKKVDNVCLTISATLQAYNVLSIVELFEYCDEKGYPMYVTIVRDPDQIAISVLPPNVLKEAASRLRTYSITTPNKKHSELALSLSHDLKKSSESFNPNDFRRFMLFTNDLDISRDQNFRDINKDLLEQIEAGGYEWTDETNVCYASVTNFPVQAREG